VSTGSISTAVGSFDSVSGVTSVTSKWGDDDYALQMNTNFFTSPLCQGHTDCHGWQQFIFSNGQCQAEPPAGPNGPCVFIEYWLIGSDVPACPTGWNVQDGCWVNSVSLYPPQQTIANLGNLSVTGQVNSIGSLVIFSSGSTLYAVQ
jgi:hypothetical protein